jgi:MFS family permease
MSLQTLWRDPGEDWPYTPAELPTIPGAPANPTHPLQRRIAYAFAGLLIGITGALGNFLVQVNQPQLQGALGLYADEMVWLPTAYVMAIVPMNLVLVKFREQFGLRLFVVGTVSTYTAITLAHLFVHSFASSIAVRAASGLVGAALTTQSIFYLAQALPLKWRLQAVACGIAIPQLSAPLARCLFASESLALGEWRSLYLCELGFTLLSLASVLMFSLPAGPRRVTYEPADFLTFALFGGGAAALSAAVGLGRYLWWRDTPWLGYALAASIPLFVSAILLERRRSNPLLALNLLVTGPFVRFVVLYLLFQVGIAEQTFGAVGLLNVAGLNNDQLHPLFWRVAIAMIVGLLASAFTLKPTRFAHMVALAFLGFAVAALLDSQVTNLTRPEQLYPSQELVGFAITFGQGALFLFGLLQAVPKGEAGFISFLAVFSMTANIGALGAGSLVGTYETLREKAHSHSLVEHVVPTDPQVAMRMLDSNSVYGSLTSDAVLRQAAGGTVLSGNVTRESTILAYIDVFQMIAALTALTALYLIALIQWRRYCARTPVGPGS